MPRGDIIANLVGLLGGSPHRDRDRGGPHFRLWGGEVKLWGWDNGRRHWFRRGGLFVARNSFGDLLHDAVAFGLGQVPDAGLHFHLSCGGHAADMPKVIREGRQAFYLDARTAGGRAHLWTFGPLEARRNPAAWPLFLGFLAHGEWRPLVDHLLETDQEFHDKWAAFEAARREAV